MIRRTITPLAFILIVLFTSLLLECNGQAKFSVDGWRLERACQDLVLLDSLVQDYAKKDSLIQDYKKLDRTRVDDIAALKHVITERGIQIENQIELSNTLIKENVLTKDEMKRLRRQRNGLGFLSAIAIGLLLIL